MFQRSAPLSSQSQERRGGALTDHRNPLLKQLGADALDEAQWDRLADWLHAQAGEYASVLTDLLAVTTQRRCR